MEVLEKANPGIKITLEDVNTLRNELKSQQVIKYTLGSTTKRREPLQKIVTTLTQTTKGTYIINTIITPDQKYKELGLEKLLDINGINEKFNSQFSKSKDSLSIGDSSHRYILVRNNKDMQLSSKTELRINTTEEFVEGLNNHSNVLKSVINNIYDNSKNGITSFQYLWTPIRLKQNKEEKSHKSKQNLKIKNKNDNGSESKSFFEKPSDITLEDVIGCEAAKEALMDLETPDELLRQLGFKPNEYSGNALLIGPPGNGKTMLARAYAATTGRNFYAIKFTDFASSLFGETELTLKRIFNEAKSNNGVIFFDEIDSITKSRENNSNDYMSGILSILQTEMDGIEKDNQVRILAATNCPENIDSSLLRPGRFDKLIEVKYPTTKNIEELLTKLSTQAEEIAGRNIFTENINYNKIAQDMRKYANVDVVEIFNRTRMDKVRILKQGGRFTQISPMDFSREINQYERKKEIGQRPSSDFDHKV